MSGIIWPEEWVFEPFDIFEETYKTVSSHDIKAAVLIPKDLKPGKHPMIINIHGGFFAGGHSLFPTFFSPWMADLAVKHGAIIVSADYRLMPTPNAVADQLEDVEDFWQWSRKDLPSILGRHASGHTLDYKQLMLVGGSAGGYHAAQVALSHPDEISVVSLQFPAVDLKDDLFRKGPEPGAPTVLRFPLSDIPSKEDSVAWIKERRNVVASKAGMDVITYCVGLTQHGVFLEQMLEYSSVRLRTEHLPIERIKARARLPKNVYITHGDDDATVYLRQSQAIVDAIKEYLPSTTLRFDIAKGEDHGFDLDPAHWKPYAEEAEAFVAEGWLR